MLRYVDLTTLIMQSWFYFFVYRWFLLVTDQLYHCVSVFCHFVIIDDTISQNYFNRSALCLRWQLLIPFKKYVLLVLLEQIRNFNKPNYPVFLFTSIYCPLWNWKVFLCEFLFSNLFRKHNNPKVITQNVAQKNQLSLFWYITHFN